MYIDTTGTVNTRWGYRTTAHKEMSHKTASFGSTQNMLQAVGASNTKSAGFTLHIGSGSEGDRMISAVAGRGKGGMTVFEPADFDPAKPVYKVCTWDENGSLTEHMVDVTKVDAADSDEASMFAYACYLSESGQYPEASDTFLRTYGYARTETDGIGAAVFNMDKEAEDQADNMFRMVKRDWTKLAAHIMQMQYDAGNLKGYLDYKKFYDFFS